MSCSTSLFRSILTLSVLRRKSYPLSAFNQSQGSCLSCRRNLLAAPKVPSHLKTMSSSVSSSSGGHLEQALEGKKMTICVEGNIGSGKTMLLDYFSSLSDEVQVLPEPVDTWRNVNGHNLLGLLYEDPARWSFPFQSYVQLSMLNTHQAPHTHPLKMMERSIFSAKYCFVENLHRSGVMSDAEYTVITEWFNWIISTSHAKVDQIIYLRSPPEYCYRNILARHRQEECGITLDYLKQLDELHESWLIHGSKFAKPAPVTVIDASRPVKDMLEYYKAHRGDILSPHCRVAQT